MSWKGVIFFMMIIIVMIMIIATITNGIMKQAKPARAVLPSYSDSLLLDKVTTPAPMGPRWQLIMLPRGRMQW